jgi:hypothetical protein
LIQARLNALRASGADRFDEADIRLVESMLERAAKASPGVRRRLEERARGHLFRLELRFESARNKASDVVKRVERHDKKSARRMRTRVERGEVEQVRRAGETALKRVDLGRYRQARGRLERFLQLADDRCAAEPALLERARALLVESPYADAELPRKLQRAGTELSLALLREGADRMRTPLEVERWRREAPKDAGPYNGQLLAADTLAELTALSPAYVRSMLQWSEGLEAMDHLPPVPEELSGVTKKASKRRRGGKRPRRAKRAK